MDVKINYNMDGARNAEGLAVIVDIFRASSIQSYLLEHGAREIVLSKTRDMALEGASKPSIVRSFAIGDKLLESSIVLPNSLYNLEKRISDIHGSIIHHYSENGVNGILEASRTADSVISACFLNHNAVVNYIHYVNPKKVTIVAMGEFGTMSVDDFYYVELLKDSLSGKNVSPKMYVDKIQNERYLLFGGPEELFGKTLPELLTKFYSELGKKDMNLMLNYDAGYSAVPKLMNGRLYG